MLKFVISHVMLAWHSQKC